MIAILAPNYQKAKSWADNQSLSEDEYFFVSEPKDLHNKYGYHVLVIGEFAEHQLSLFERTYHLAKINGKFNRI